MSKVYTLTIGLFLLSFLSTPVQAQTWEVYDTKYDLQARLIYDDIELLSETVRIGKRANQLFLLSADLKPAVSLVGHEVYQYLQPWILVKGAAGIGAFHEYGQQVLPLEYDEIDTYINLLLARKGNEYWVFERGRNKTTFLGELELAKITNTGVIIIKRDGEYSMPLSAAPDKTFELLEDNDGAYILAKEPTGYGLINREGNYVMNPILESLTHTHGDFFYGFDEEQYLLVQGGDVNADVRYNSFHKITYENDLMLEYIHGKLRRVMEEDGILYDGVGMEEVRKIGKDLYNIRFRDGKLSLLGKKGMLVQPTAELDEINFGTDGLFPAKQKSKIGFVDATGAWVIKPEFTAIKPFSENIAAVESNHSWGLINKQGDILGASNWSDIKSFSNGTAIAKSMDKYFLINTTGTPLNTEGFDNISRTANGYFLVEKAEKTGMLNAQGQEVLPIEFEHIRRERKDFVIVQKDGLTGVIKESGEVVFPLAYEDILVDWTNNQIFTKNLYVPVLIQEAETPSKRRRRGE